MAVAHQRVILEADGGSRGNPGPAGFGALIRDADTGEVIAEAAESIGRASNNVAEYRGLIAGLELYREHTPDAQLEARMDSKLVIEQMAGRWKVKHPDMRPLAIAAQRLAPSGTLWTWVPRERNSAADRLANLAMDAAARGEVYDVRSGHRSGSMTSASGATNQPGDPTPDSMEPPAPGTSAAAGPPTRRLMRGTGDGPAKDGDLRRGDEPRTGAADPMLGWSGLHGEATTLILLRHGETRHTAGRKFSGPGGDDPELNEIGWRQVQRAAQAISADGGVDAILSSPLRRTRETARAVSEVLDVPVEIAPGYRECAFGEWDGFDLAEVEQRWPNELAAWMRALDVAPPGGESMLEVQQRVEETLVDTLSSYAGKTVLVVSHVNPIKLCVRYCLDAPIGSINRMLLAPASLTTLSFYATGASALRQFSALP